MHIQLKQIALPEFGLPSTFPQLSLSIYQNRLQQLRQYMQQRNLNALVIYADREHTANLTYLCGYDPRFEESILIITPNQTPALLVGNEGWGYADIATILPVKKILYQPLSLLGQSRSNSKTLQQIFIDEGIQTNHNIGIAGWKYFTAEEFEQPQHIFEVPHYIVQTLSSITGSIQQLFNANDIFMNATNGMRTINEAAQLAQFEFAACYTSNGVKNVLHNIQPGMTELQACTLMQNPGLPQSAHSMLTAGARAKYGLPSPGTDVLVEGTPFTTAYSLWGALNCRAGWFAKDENSLPAGAKDYVQKLAIPYFKAVVKWLQYIGIGVKGEELYNIVHQEIGDPFFGVHLNPGHTIHIDEWVHSPIYKNSQQTIQSGMALQVDIIPATGTIYHTINIEDGIAIADEALRNQLQNEYPEMWQRITARRKFMQQQLGITLKPEVLPFSNMPAYLPPFILSHNNVLTVSKN